MKKIYICFLLLFLFQYGIAQSSRDGVQQVNTTTEQQLENLTEANNDAEPDDDSYRQEMLQYLHHPINLNTADEESFKGLRIITVLQAANLILYRNRLGRLIDIYELQAVPGWDIRTIEKIRAYVTVNNAPDLFASVKQRLRGGDHELLFRASETLERSAGYRIDPASGKNYYAGSPQKILLRYHYRYKNLLQYGILGEKDAGEQFFRGKQKQGFDFYSAHFFLRKLGIIKSLAIGDYSVNMGQGLVQWMSLAFKKGPDVSSADREADVLRPYNSPGEVNFHRGIGITLTKKHKELTFFASYRHIDANFAAGDTAQTTDDLVTALQTSGYHRTPSESADKGVQRELTFGGNISLRITKIRVGFNAVHYQYKYPLIKADEPYNLFALTGKNFGNYSVDYSYTYRNIHLFGEAAITQKKAPALITGLLMSLSADADLSLVYRNISPKYQSLYTDAFTENSAPSNEQGLFAGATLRPATGWRLDAYGDLFHFPWLKYRVNAISDGSEYMVQLTYKPNKMLEIYSRYKAEKKMINFDTADHVLTPVIMQPKKDWRIQISYALSQRVSFRSRMETVWFDQKGAAAETGFLLAADMLWHPARKPWSGNIRVQYFDTDGYNSRLYAYENDVLYSYAVPVSYGRGYRYYLNADYDINKKTTIWIRVSQSVYPGQHSISSYLDEIKKSHKTGLELQLRYIF